MKTIWIIAVIALLGATVAVQAQFVHIYQLGVGHGDCSLIVVSDKQKGRGGKDVLTAMIVDAGYLGSVRIGRLWTSIEQYLALSGAAPLAGTPPAGTRRLDAFYYIASHLDRDHIRGTFALLPHMQLWCTPVTIIDRIYDPDGPAPYNVRPYTTTDLRIRYGTFTAGMPRLNIGPGEDLFAYRNITMTCVAANGYVQTSTVPNNVATPNHRDENDLSFAWMIRFDRFRFFTGGDLSGVGGSHFNMETALRTGLRTINSGATAWHCCVFKASHHGSSTSTNADFLDLIRPKFCIISAARMPFSSVDPLPTPATITALQGISCHVFYTYRPSTSSPLWPTVAQSHQAQYCTLPRPDARVSRYRDVLVAVGRRISNRTQPLTTGATVELEFGYQERQPGSLVTIGGVEYNDYSCTH